MANQLENKTYKKGENKMKYMAIICEKSNQHGVKDKEIVRITCNTLQDAVKVGSGKAKFENRYYYIEHKE